MTDLSLYAIGIVCVFLTLYMNDYKFFLMEYLDTSSVNNKYPIFPWQQQPQLSNSSISWLQLHLSVSIIHVILSTLWMLKLEHYFRHVLAIPTICIITYIIYPIEPSLMIFTSECYWINRISIVYFLISMIDEKIIHMISHVLFTMIIIPNMLHFGNKSPVVAVIANGLPLLLANISYFYKKPSVKDSQYMRLLYYMLFTSPVWLESTLYFLRH